MKRFQIVYGLPLEVWMDIFCYPWISRREFGKLVDKVGNFKFAEHAQFYLHEWGNRILDGVKFDKDGLCIFDDEECRLEVPQTPLPPNIKMFLCIEIHHFDTTTMDFLGRIGSLLTNQEIEVRCNFKPDNWANVRTILTNLAPMLDGIRMFFIPEIAFTTVKEHFFRENEKLATLNCFQISYIGDKVTEMAQPENVDFIMNWLNQPDDDGPRLFESDGYDVNFADQIFKAIREQFFAAKLPRTFAVDLTFLRRRFEIAEFHLENSIGEELHGKWASICGMEVLQITRHQAKLNTEEVHEWIEAMTKEVDYPTIWIEKPTIGSLDVAQANVPHVNEEQAKEQQKPCSSKDI